LCHNKLLSVVLFGGVTGAGEIGLVDDLLFAGLDLSGGYKSVGEVGLELGKKVASAAVSVGVGAAFNGVGNITESLDAVTGKVVKTVEAGGISKLLAGKLGDGFGQVALDAGLAGVQTYTSVVASSFVGAWAST
jgi:hypothetical protein